MCAGPPIEDASRLPFLLRLGRSPAGSHIRPVVAPTRPWRSPPLPFRRQAHPSLPPARHPSVVAARSSPVSPDKSISVVASPIPICRRRFFLLPCPFFLAQLARRLFATAYSGRFCRIQSSWFSRGWRKHWNGASWCAIYLMMQHRNPRLIGFVAWLGACSRRMIRINRCTCTFLGALPCNFILRKRLAACFF
jgi:hypothetical protein